MDLKTEIKRKIFHHLSLLYLLVYVVFPRGFCLGFLFAVLAALAATEFIRLRRPELNAWFLKKFGGLHRPTEILAPSGIFWTLLGCWITMAVFTDQRIVLPALGFLVFGDTAAALVGRKWGRHPWPKNPVKTLEGSAAFAVVSAIWALFFVHWPVAAVGAAVVAWIEAQPFAWNDNLWMPTLGGLALSVLNLLFG